MTAPASGAFRTVLTAIAAGTTTTAGSFLVGGADDSYALRDEQPF
jgi:hypothetical protein